MELKKGEEKEHNSNVKKIVLALFIQGITTVLEIAIKRASYEKRWLIFPSHFSPSRKSVTLFEKFQSNLFIEKLWHLIKSINITIFKIRNYLFVRHHAIVQILRRVIKEQKKNPS